MQNTDAKPHIDMWDIDCEETCPDELCDWIIKIDGVSEMDCTVAIINLMEKTNTLDYNMMKSAFRMIKIILKHINLRGTRTWS